MISLSRLIQILNESISLGGSSLPLQARDEKERLDGKTPESASYNTMSEPSISRDEGTKDLK